MLKLWNKYVLVCKDVLFTVIRLFRGLQLSNLLVKNQIKAPLCDVFTISKNMSYHPMGYLLIISTKLALIIDGVN